MPLDDVLGLAVDRGQGAEQQRHAGYARGPLRAGKAVRAFQSILAGKPLGDIELVGGEDIDAEKPETPEQRP